jgi:hypothetical protein
VAAPNAARDRIAEIRRLAKTAKPRFPLIAITKVIPPTPGYRRRAAIKIGGASSHFNNPTYCLAKMVSDALDPSKAPMPCKSIDPATVTSTALADARPMTKTPYWKMAKARMHKSGARWLRSWHALHHPCGWYFMFSDKLILLTWTAQAGWSHTLVPEDGLDVNLPGRYRWTRNP